MTIAIHQPNFIPYPGYFNKMMKADYFVYLDHVQYTSGGADAVTNRNKIKTAQGAFSLTVPVIKTSGPNICEIMIDYKQDWVGKMIKTIEMAYKKSPFYHEVSDWFFPILLHKIESLSELNIQCIEAVKQYLNIQIPSAVSSKMNLDPALQKDDLLIAITTQLNGTTYLSGKGGLKYMELEKYAEAKIKVVFNQFTPIEYPQLGKEFIPNLSILDLLFNTGKNAMTLIKEK